MTKCVCFCPSTVEMRKFMQNNTVLKLGMAALMSVMMVACASNDTEDTATVVTPPPAATARPAADPNALTAEQIRARDAALAKRVFYFEFDRAELSQED